VEKYGTAKQTTDDDIMWRMHFACWVTRQEFRRTPIILNTYCFSIATVVTQTYLNVMCTLPVFLVANILLQITIPVCSHFNSLSVF